MLWDLAVLHAKKITINKSAVVLTADVASSNLSNSIATGANVVDKQSNALVLGSVAKVGIGTGATNSSLTVAGINNTKK